jgi:hypothetical protein
MDDGRGNSGPGLIQAGASHTTSVGGKQSILFPAVTQKSFPSLQVLEFQITLWKTKKVFKEFISYDIADVSGEHIASSFIAEEKDKQKPSWSRQKTNLTYFCLWFIWRIYQ